MKNKLLKLLACSSAILLVGAATDVSGLFGRSGRGAAQNAKEYAERHATMTPISSGLRPTTAAGQMTVGAPAIPVKESRKQKELFLKTASAIKQTRDTIANLILGQNKKTKTVNVDTEITKLTQHSADLRDLATTFNQEFTNGTALQPSATSHLCALLTACGAPDQYSKEALTDSGWMNIAKKADHVLTPQKEEQANNLIQQIELSISSIRERAQTATAIADTWKTYDENTYLSLSANFLTGSDQLIANMLRAHPVLMTVKAVLEQL